MRSSSHWLAVGAALVGVALTMSSAEACHKRRCGGRMACAGGGGCSGGYAGGYSGGYAGGCGGYAPGGPGMASYAPSPQYGGYSGMASYPSPQYGGYPGTASYPGAPYGGPMVGSPYNAGMPAAGGYSSAYGTAPAAYGPAPGMAGGVMRPGGSFIPPAPVVSEGAVPAAPAPAAPAIPR